MGLVLLPGQQIPIDKLLALGIALLLVILVFQGASI